MVVKIFPAQASFSAIGYNLNKVSEGKAVLLKAIGFDGLRHLTEVRQQDYLNYLEARTALNRHIRKPQFHAMISAPDAAYDQNKLLKLGQQWLKAMGYGEQPCLLVFHRDTDQAHIHLVTTRVDRDGRKIDSAFEHRRAVAELNKLMALDEAHQAQLDAGKAMAYQFSTRAQLSLLLEGMGYRVTDKDGALVLFKFGKPLFRLLHERVDKRLAGYAPDGKRAAQLKAIFRKYQGEYHTALGRETTPLAGGRWQQAAGFHSEFSDFMHDKFGLELVFHAAGDKPPYGYTIIDHAQLRVWKGSEVMRLKELIEPGPILQQAHGTTGEAVSGRSSWLKPLQLYFTNDVDDQQIHGPRRRRQKKARTNTR